MIFKGKKSKESGATQSGPSFNGLNYDSNLETLEVHEMGASSSRHHQEPRAPDVRSMTFSRRKAIIVSSVLTGVVLLFTGASSVFLSRTDKNMGETPVELTSDLTLRSDEEFGVPVELQGSEESLVIKGDLITQGVIKISNGGNVMIVQATNLTDNRTFSLPDVSGTFCTDANNCNYAGLDQIGQLNTQMARLGQQLSDFVLTADSGVTSLNNQTGVISLQGSTNRIQVNTAGGVITLSTPQDLDANANVQFGSLTVSPTGAINANTFNQTVAGSNVSISAGNDAIVFTAGGRSFQLPVSGPGAQTICTDGGALCATGTGEAVLLSDGAAQADSDADASIFINDTGGGHLIRLQSMGIDRLAVDNLGNTTVGGSLTVSALGNGFVRSAAGALNVVSAIDLASTDVTNTLPVNRGGTGASSLMANGVLMGNGSSPVSSVAAGGSGLCLVSTAGAPTFTTCPGVSSLNGQGGSITLQGTANQVNVSTAAGVITLSTPQDINTSSSPTFAALTLSGLSDGALRASAGTLTTGLVSLTAEVSGTLPVANGGTGTAVVPTNGQLLIGNGTNYTLATLSQGAGTVITNGAGSITIASAFGNSVDLGGETTGDFVATIGGTGGVTVSAGSGAGSSPTVSLVLQANKGLEVDANGLSLVDCGLNQILKYNGTNQWACAPDETGSFTVAADSGTPQSVTNGDTVTVQGGTNIATSVGATDNIIVNTVNNPTFTTSVTTPLLQSSGALTITPNGALTVGSTGQTALLQGSATTISSNGLGNDIVLSSADQIRFSGFDCSGYANGGTLTTDASGNISCSDDNGAATSTVTGTGTANRIALYTGAQTIADSWLLQNGSTLEIDSTRNLSVTGGNFSVTGTGLFTGLITANGGLTIEAGDTFTFNGEAFTDLTGTGLQLSSGSLQTTLGTSIDLTTEVTGVLPVANGGTGVNGSTAANGTLLIGNGTGFTLATLTAGAGITVNNSAGGIEVVNVFGTSIESAEIVDLTIANTDIANGTIDISTKTTGNYVATIGGSSQVSVSGSGSNNAAITLGIIADSIGDAQLVFDTGQNLTTTSSPSFNGLTLSGNLAVQGGNTTVGTATQAGSLMLSDGSANTGSLQTAGLGQNTTFTLPDPGAAAATICLSTGNCAGTGGGVTTVGGTANRITMFNGAQTVADSWLLQTGSTLQIDNTRNLELIGGNLIVGGNQATSGTVTFSALANGFLEVNGSGLVSVGTIDLGADTTGNFVATITNGNGISGSSATEGGAPTIALGNLTADWVQSGAFDIVLSNAGAELRILESVGGTFYGTFDVGDLSTDQTYTFLQGGTVVTSSNVSSFATTGVTAGNGLTGGGTTGVLTLDIGAGNGITVNANDIAVMYGSTANTAVQGNTSLTVTAGTNLSGGGSITLGAGGTVTLNVSDSPTFAGTVTVQGSKISIGTASTTTGLLDLYNAASTFAGSVQVASLGQATVYTLPDPGTASATVCLSTGNCAGSGGGVTTAGGSANRLAKFNGAQSIANSTISDDGTSVNTSVDIIIQGGDATLGSATQAGRLVLSDGTSNTASIVLAPQALNYTYTIPDAGADDEFCIRALGNCSGAGGGNAPNSAQYLTLALDGGLSAERTLSFNGTNFSVTDGGVNGAYSVNTVQSIATTSTPSFAGMSLTGNLSMGTNIIQGTTAVIDFTNFDVASTGAVTAGTYNGQTISAAASFTGTVSVAGLTTLNGGLTIQTGDTLTLNGDGFTDLTGNGLTVTLGALNLALQANKGLEVDASGLSLIDCANGEVLKYNTTGGTWGCATDAGAAGTGDDVLVNGTNADGANFINTTASAAVAGVTINLNSTATPDEISLQIGDASGTLAGIVTANAQTFGGAKTFNGQIVAGAGINLGAQTLSGTTAVIDFNNFDVSSTGAITAVGVNAGSGLIQGTGGITIAGTTTLSSLTNGFLEVNGTGVVSVGTIDLGTDTAGNYVATITSGNGVSAAATGEASTPTIALANLTADWLQSGAFDIVLDNASSELKIKESGLTPTFYAILDTADLSADQTFTLNQGGTVVTSGNVGSYATTGVTAGSGLTGGGTIGALALNIGAGNGVSVAVDSITLSLQANKGLEVDANGLSLIDCAANQILKYNGTNQWVCAADSDTDTTLTEAQVESYIFDTDNVAGATSIAANANGINIFTLRRNTDTSPTGNFLSLQNAAAANLFNVDINGTVTAGTWQGSEIADAYISNSLTIASTGSVDWAALTNYPTGCAAGTAVTTIGDTLTCGSFLTTEADTLATVTGRGATTATASSFTGGATIRGLTVDTATATQDLLLMNVAPTGAARFTGTITNADLTANRTYTLPNASGTLAVSASGNIALSAAGNISFTGTLPVANGGTGATTHTAGGILFGNGTSAFTNSGVLTNGQLLIGDGTGAPTVGTLTAGTGISITNGPGTITVASTLGTTIEGSEITDGTINAVDVESTNLADATTDTYVLTYNHASGGFTYVSQATVAGAGGSSVTSLNGLTGALNIAGSSQISVSAASPNISLSIAADSIGTAQIATDGVGSAEIINGSVANADLTNSSLTVTSGDGLTGCGSVSLGGSCTLAVGAGTGLSVAADSIGFDYAATLAGNPALTANQTTFGSTGLIFEGSLADTFETLLNTTNPTVDRTITLPDASGTVAVSASGNIALSAAGNISFSGTLPVANGGTGQTTLQAAINSLSGLTTNGDLLYHNGTNATRLARGTNGQCLTSNATTIAWGSCGLSSEADTLATVTARGATTSTASSFTGGATIRGLTVDTATTTQDRIVLGAATLGAARFDGTITNADLTGARTYTLPDATGTFITTGNLTNITTVGTITAGTWQGSEIADAYVSNSITIASTGSVDWAALTNYPTGCAAGQAITAVGDTLTCGTFAATDTNTTYSAGNDLDISGTTFNLESQLDFVSTINQTAANLTLQTTTSGNILLNAAGNVGVGDTTPDYKLEVQGSSGSGYLAVSNASDGDIFNINSSGNVGIGDATPVALFTVGNGDLFQVNSSGAIAAATGITTSGAYTQSGAGANTFSGASSFTAAGTALTVTNNAVIGGNLNVGILGTANTVSYLCRNSSNQIAGCNTTGTGAMYVQGGNSFGAAAVLGTNDANSLSFETNNSIQLTIADGGVTTFKNSVNSTSAVRIQNSAGTNIFAADTTNNIIKTETIEALSVGTVAQHTIVKTLESANSVGWTTDIELGQDGFPRIVHFDNTNFDLRFLRCLDASCNTFNVTTPDTTATPTDTGWGAELNIAADGFGRISHVDYDTNDLRFTQCTNADCSTAVNTSIDTAATASGITGMALASDGFARIVYTDISGSGNLKFIQCTNASCSTNVVTTLDSAVGTAPGMGKIGMGTDGFAQIAYYDSVNDDLKFIHCTNAACTTRNAATLDSAGDVGAWHDLAVGTDGFARIAYVDYTNADLKYIRCTNADCTANVITVVESESATGDTPQLKLGTDGLARIVYNDYAAEDLKYARCTNADCTTSVIRIIDSIGSVGDYAAIALDSNSYPSISYFDRSAANLKFARLTSESGDEVISGASVGTSTAAFGEVNAKGINLMGGLSIDNNGRAESAIKVQGGGVYFQAFNAQGGLTYEINENQFSFRPTADSYDAFNVMNSTGSRILTIDTASQTVAIGLDGNGKLAIGDSSPTADLEVVAASNALTDVGTSTNYLAILRNENAVNGYGAGLGFTVTNTDNNIGASIIFERTSTNAMGNLRFYTKQTTAAGADPTLLLTLGANGNTYIGNTTDDAVGNLLVVDTKNTVGDPTGANGGMYYNSNTGVFRCYQNGIWVNCIGGGGSTSLQQAYDTDADGSDAIITQTAADDSLIFRNPASGGTDSTFVLRVEQLNTGAKDGLVVTQAGTGYAFRVNDDGTATDSTPFVIDSGGNVGVGKAVPEFKLHVQGADSSHNFITNDAYGGIAAFQGRRANGTAASPTVILGGDALAQFSARGYDGTAFTGTRGAFVVQAAGNWSGTSNPTALTFQFTPLNSTTLTGAGAFNEEGALTIAYNTLNSQGAKLRVYTDADTRIGAIIQGTAAQTADLLQLKRDTLNVLTVSATGSTLLQNSTDSTTGFRVLDADGGVPVLSVDTANERVGIGYASPNQKLHVLGGASEDVAIKVERGANTQRTALIVSPAGTPSAANPTWGLGIPASSADFNIWAYDGITDTNRLTILNTSGNVGVGDATPDYKMEIQGSSGSGYFAVTNSTDGDIFAINSSGTAVFGGNVVQVGNGVNALGDQESMVPNAGFEVNEDATTTVADGWTFTAGATPGTASVTTTTPGQGTYSQQMVMSSASASGSFLSGCVPVSDGQTYSLSLRFRGAAASTNVLDTFLRAYATKSDCESDTSAAPSMGVANISSTTSWTAQTSNHAVAAGYTWARAQIMLGGGGTATTLYIDAVRLTPSTITSGIDIAENFPALKSDDLKPGELVSFGAPAPEGGSYVIRSNGAYDRNAFGVVTTKPGLTLDDGGAYHKVAVALTGRVPVKVNGENGAIAIGDPITASSVPGVGMKATVTGKIIGTAVTAFDGTGEGTITVLINPEFYAPPMSEQLQGNALSADNLHITGTADITTLNVSGTATINTLIVLSDATIEGVLTVQNLIVKQHIVVEGHYYSEGEKPLVEKGVSLGADIMQNNQLVLAANVELDGTDTAGTITIVAGENAQKGVLGKVMFNKAYDKTPRIVLSAINEDGMTLPVFARKVDGGFEIVTSTVPVAGKTYQFDYVIIGSSSTTSLSP